VIILGIFSADALRCAKKIPSSLNLSKLLGHQIIFCLILSIGATTGQRNPQKPGNFSAVKFPEYPRNY
jgi:hypothetical protein